MSIHVLSSYVIQTNDDYNGHFIENWNIMKLQPIYHNLNLNHIALYNIFTKNYYPKIRIFICLRLALRISDNILANYQIIKLVY